MPAPPHFLLAWMYTAFVDIQSGRKVSSCHHRSQEQ